MNYKLGEKYAVNDTIGTVVYINQGWAWVTPDIDDDDLKKGVVFSVLDEKGVDMSTGSKGKKLSSVKVKSK